MEMFPPDNYREWTASCAILKEMHGLRSLHVDIIVWDTHKREDPTIADDDALISFLQPLNRISAPFFEVEMNMTLPEVVLESLGKLKFTLVVKRRPYERRLFPFYDP